MRAVSVYSWLKAALWVIGVYACEREWMNVSDMKNRLTLFQYRQLPDSIILNIINFFSTISVQMEVCRVNMTQSAAGCHNELRNSF